MHTPETQGAKMQGIAILGATGSVGLSTLEVIARHPQLYRVVGLAANRQVERLFQQCVAFQPDFAVMQDADAAEQLRRKLQSAGIATCVQSGDTALCDLAAHQSVDIVMAAIVGAAGLMSTLCAARAGKRLLLANKEALVMSGQLLMDEVAANDACLLPIDSEHNAIFQCVSQAQSTPALNGVKKILLTASGGPFRTLNAAALQRVTPEQACAHPNWAMGRKISVDSSTLMNKGLEVIEACWLFAVDVDRIEVILHPQSVIHSMVSYVDGSVLAQLGNPDMRTPIAHALAWPKRIESGVEPPDFLTLSALTFDTPDTDRFPCLRLAIETMRVGGTATTILNAANEVAVAAFLDGRLAFTEIPALIEDVLGRVPNRAQLTLENVLEVDRQTREVAEARLTIRPGRVA